MTPRTIGWMKQLDERLGSILAGLLPLPRSTGSDRAPERVLVIKFWGIGSLILAAPAIAHLRAAWPLARIDLLTLAGNEEVARLIGGIDAVRSLRLDSLPQILRELVRLRRDLARARYDLAIDLEFFVHTSSLLAAAAGIARRIGFARRRGGKRRLLTHTTGFDPSRHTAVNFLALAATATGTCASERGTATRSAGVTVPEEGRDLFARFGLHGPYVVVNVNVGALALERRWPAESFAELIRRFGRETDLDLVLIGSVQERAYVGRIAGLAGRGPRLHDLTGTTSLAELAHLLAGAALVVSSDSGPAHLAAAVGAPVVALFGPETPERYGPVGPRVRVIYGARFCSPCMTIENAKTVRCAYRAACMREITVDQVWAAIQAELVPQAVIPATATVKVSGLQSTTSESASSRPERKAPRY